MAKNPEEHAVLKVIKKIKLTIKVKFIMLKFRVIIGVLNILIPIVTRLKRSTEINNSQGTADCMQLKKLDEVENEKVS